MADKQMTRLEAKIDALLEKAGIKPADVQPAAATPAPRKLSAAEQDAIDNAPKPSPVTGPATTQRTDPRTNAPVVPTGASVPQGAVGNVTVETVETMPVDSDQAAREGAQQRAADANKPALPRRSERREI